MDNSKATDFSISPNTMVKYLQKEFKENFGLTLRVYNGIKYADGDKTFGSFKSSNTKAQGFKVKAKMQVDEVEDLFKEHFGLQVQTEKDSHLVPKKNIRCMRQRRILFIER